MYQVFLKLAIEDLRAAEYLLDGKFFPQSVFYLEQSVEKAVKSLGLRLKVITEEEAGTEIGHEAWRIHFKIFNALAEQVQPFRGLLEQYPQLHENRWIKLVERYSSEFMGKIDELDKLKAQMSPKKRDKEFRALMYKLRMLSQSNEQLGKVLEELDRLSDTIRELSKTIEQLAEDIKKVKETDQYKLLLQQLSSSAPSQYQSYIEELRKLKLSDKDELSTVEDFKNLLMVQYERLSKFVFCLFSLFYLSIVFVPHVTTSRYPDGHSNESDPLKAYDANTPLIRMMGRFIDQTKKVLETLDELYRMEEQTRPLTSLL